MIAELLLGSSSASKCRTIDVCDIFGDSSGVALYQLDGNANDESGNYHGTETAITYGGGVYERGAVFNGTSSRINFTADASTKTISFWTNKPITNGTAKSFFGSSGATGDHCLIVGDWTAFVAGETISMYAQAGGATSFAYITDIINDTTWKHVVVQYVSLGVYQFYINGVSRTVSYGMANVPNGINVLSSMGTYNDASGWLDASIDQVRIFNRAITATEVATLYAECAPTSTVSVDDNILNQAVAHYKLDGNALDTTGNYNGTETAMTYADGRFGQAGVFNGSTSKVAIPVFAVTAISFWFNPATAQTGTSGGWLYEGRYTGEAGWALVWDYNTTDALAFADGTGQRAAGAVLTKNVWHHVVCTVTGSTATVYVDGAVYLTTPVTFDYTVNLHMIGAYGATNFFVGSIDQVRIYNKALTATDVTALYNEALPTSTVDTVQPLGDTSVKAFYKFDGDATDATGTYNGTATNVTYSAGKFGNAAVIGSAGVITTSTGMSPVNFTFSAWVNLTNVSANRSVLFGTINPASIAVGYSIQVINSQLYFMSSANGSSWQALYSIPFTVVNSWEHITVSVSAGVPTMYVDGNKGVLTTTNGGQPVQGAGGDRIGWATAGTFSGSIDQVRIFNKALTSQEVQAIYSESSYAKTTLPTVELDPFLDNSCKALYKFDNNALDAYGQYDGTATNVTYGTGKFGQCAVFNGTSSNVLTNYVVPTSTQLSASVWIKSGVTGTNMAILADGNSLGQAKTTRLNIVIYSTNNFAFSMGDGTSGWTESTSSALSVLDNKWHHIVLTIVGVTHKLYIDGELKYNKTSTISLGTATTYNVNVGQLGDYSGYFFNGSIDQTRIFNKALTPLEVASLYNETTPLEEPMYKLVDPFKDGSGKALYRLEGNALDESGNYNLTATGTYSYVNGRFGRAIANSTDGQYLTYPAVSGWNSTSNGAVTMWIYMTSNADNTTGLFDSRTAGGLGAQFNFNDGTNVLKEPNGTAASTNMSLNTWYFFAFSLVRSTNTWTVIQKDVNGTTLNTKTFTFAHNATANNNIGSIGSSTLYSFRGYIEQVRFFGRNLTTQEIDKLAIGEDNVL